MTDSGVIALSHECDQLQIINLSYCREVTDAGVIALGHGCGQLQSITLDSCGQMTDAGISFIEFEFFTVKFECETRRIFLSKKKFEFITQNLSFLKFFLSFFKSKI